MGADSSLFALKSKKYYYFDRDYNIRAHDWVDDCSVDEDQIQSSLHNEMKSWLSNGDMLYYLKTNIEIWEEFGDEKDKRRVIWSKRLINFVNAHPEDRFRVVTLGHVDYDDLSEEFEEVPELDMEL